MDIKIVFQAGNVTGGYAFSANKPEITLPGYAETMDESLKAILIFEATTARNLYAETVAKKKAAGEKVNPLTIKREAVEAAKKAAIEKFGEENYNAMKKVMDDNKGGNQSVTGKSSKKSPKAATSKAPKGRVDKSIPAGGAPLSDAEMNDLEKEFGSAPADAGDDAPGGDVPDPFEEL